MHVCGRVGNTDDDVVAGRVEIVADELGKGALLVAPGFLPLSATRVAFFRRAFGPGLQHLEGVWQVLEHHDTAVEHRFALAVGADSIAVCEYLSCVDGHRDGRIGRDVPPAEEEFHGHFEVLDDGVGVDEDDEFVRRQHRLEDMRLDPAVPVAAHVLGVVELVVVAVDLGCCVSGPSLGALSCIRLTVNVVVDV